MDVAVACSYDLADTRPRKKARHAVPRSKTVEPTMTARPEIPHATATTGETTETAPWSHLPDETWDLIVNGADSRGRAFLPWHYRVCVRATCRRLRAIVSSPRAADRKRFAVGADPLGKRAVGAVVCVLVGARLFESAPLGTTLARAVEMLRATYLDSAASHDTRVLTAAALVRDGRYNLDVAAAIATAQADRDGINTLIDPWGIGDYCGDAQYATVAGVVYGACVAHGCAAGADIAAPFLSLYELMGPVLRAIKTDDVDAVVDAVRHARRCAPPGHERRNLSVRAARTKPHDLVDDAVWTAVLIHGTPSVAARLVDEVPQEWLVLKVHAIDREETLRVRSTLHDWSFSVENRWSGRAGALVDAERLVRRAIANGDVLLVAWAVSTYEEHMARAGHADPPFGPLSVDDVVCLAMRAGTYVDISLWLTQWTDERPTAGAVERALDDAPSRRPTTRADVGALVADWTREAVDARDGQALVAYLAWSNDAEVARGPARRAMLPFPGPLTCGLWEHHVRAVGRAWNADDMTRLCKALIALCRGARRWGLLDTLSPGAARALRGGTCDEWAIALDRILGEHSDCDLWALWRGAVQPLRDAAAIRRAATWWADSDERSIVLGALDLLDHAVTKVHA
nr:F-box domain containing protein [Pandoravirus belohorizontensis]